MPKAEVLTIVDLDRKYSRANVLILSLIFNELYLRQLRLLPSPPAGDVHQTPTLTTTNKVDVIVILQERMDCFLNSPRTPHCMNVLFN